jgi:hypothetical protein
MLSIYKPYEPNEWRRACGLCSEWTAEPMLPYEAALSIRIVVLYQLKKTEYCILLYSKMRNQLQPALYPPTYSRGKWSIYN